MKKIKPREPFEGHLTSFFFMMLIILLSTQVFFRFVLNKNISWSEEVSRFVFVWAMYFGFALAANKDRHIRVVAHLMYLPKRMQMILLTISDLLWVAYNILLIFMSFKYLFSMIEFPYYSQTIGINLFYIYLIVPIGFCLMTIRIVQNIFKRLHKELSVTDSRKNL